MFALADCNNFYCNCERVFRPELKDKPVAVLSNNDGCVIARSNEIKRLGIKMGVPAFQIPETFIKAHDITLFSSNYTLYGDMSSRVMSILQNYSPEIEIYSIDEAFLDFHGMDLYDLKDYGYIITKDIFKQTGLPVSLGIAPTKTLAKVANKFAKKFKSYKSVCLIDSEEKRIKALKLTDISDVWGIGWQHTKRLNKLGVKTAYDFTQLNRGWVRKNMTVVGEKTWRELHGEPCVEMELITPKKKQICTSRAFGKTQISIEGLKEAIANYASICAEKLRQQNSYAVSLMIFIHTNNFREDLPQYWRNYVIKLPVPTNSTLELVKYALKALKIIYRVGFQYKKAGVIITEITDNIQHNLFYNLDHNKHNRLMEVMDRLNQKGFNSTNVKLAIQSNDYKSKLRREKLSPCYSTRISDIITLNCK